MEEKSQVICHIYFYNSSLNFSNERKIGHNELGECFKVKINLFVGPFEQVSIQLI